MEMNQFRLWQRTLANQGDELDAQREILRQALLEFRSNVEHLVSEIGGLLPDLTVHSISHLDALWRIADEIAGPDYPINPAEAFVLGGAILLHDSAHVLAAYEDRLDGLTATSEWKDLIAQEFEGKDPLIGTPEHRYSLFQVMRQLHARQASQLPFLKWKIPGNTTAELRLLPHPALLEYYGALIGELAESHHWPSQKVGEVFDTRHVNLPAFLTPATWQVDALKIAFLLRTADAAHVDAQRAPWFLFALRQPKGVSENHWRFQAKLGQPTRNGRGEIRLTSSPFGPEERRSWWLAYDTARMIDRELRAAHQIMRDLGRRSFSAIAVARVSNPATFARDVLVTGWEPIDVAPKISDVSRVISNLGGAKLYGDEPALALRELLQNSADAVRALRALGNIGSEEGEIEVRLERINSENWLHVKDTGIGMSRHVLTQVLLDFGTSFWSSESSRMELPGLASTGFKPIGKFGIGFFSTFMLGTRIKVNTKRFRRAVEDNTDQWILEFGDSVDSRPMLRQPTQIEELKRAGTQVSVQVSDEVLKKFFGAYGCAWEIEGIQHKYHDTGEKSFFKQETFQLDKIVAALCPTIDINVRVRVGNELSILAIRPNDWLALTDEALFARIYPKSPIRESSVKKTPYINLLDNSLAIVGRIRHAPGYGAVAVCTHGGIRSGNAPQLNGVLLGDNSPDLARRESTPVASVANWQEWATKALNILADRDSTAATDLHPLCLEKESSIYFVNGKYLTASRLKEWLANRSEVSVFDGLFEYEDSDEVSRDSFRERIKRDPDVVFLPYCTDEFSKFIKISSVDYQNEFQSIIKSVWGDQFYHDQSHECVGFVDSTEIERSVHIYERDS